LRWYVVKVQSGREEAAQQALQRRAQADGLEGALGRIVIPVEKVAELRHGRRVERTRKLFPGYLLCEVALDDQMRALFGETAGVGEFVGGSSTPVPLSPAEVERLVGRPVEEQAKVILPDFSPGDQVRVLRGTFAQMEGEVAEVLPATGQVRVRLTILGRPVLLDVEAFEVLQLDGGG
jgi:transcriptional antiterminator NusG